MVSSSATSLSLLLLLLLLLALVCLAVEQGQRRPIPISLDCFSDSKDFRNCIAKVPIPSATPTETAVNYTIASIGSVKAHVVVVPTDSEFLVVMPKDSKLQRTSRQSRSNHCDVAAVNGGPYNADGSSSGPLVINGDRSDGDETDFVGFGATESSWVVGRYPLVRHLPLRQFVTGFDWLVYDGVVTVIDDGDDDDNDTGAQRASRTAIGVDRKGLLFLVAVDGCERCIRKSKRGPTLYELATFLSDQLHLAYAINLDGGGSTTMMVSSENEKKPVNRPTCLDMYYPICQRAVASVVCIKRIKNGSLILEEEEDG